MTSARIVAVSALALLFLLEHPAGVAVGAAAGGGRSGVRGGRNRGRRTLQEQANADGNLFDGEEDEPSSAASAASGGGCLGGVKGVTYFDDDDKCNCASVACTKETCEDDMGGTWTDECPACDPDECDPLAPSDEDPSCTGPPEAIDRFGKKMYRRKLISREKPQDSKEQGVFCHVIFELCEGESMITQGMDSGFGDYYRLGATAEWADYKGTAEYGYGGMYKPTGARSYSPVTPLDENTVQLTIKEVKSDPTKNDCTAGVDCLFGMSELACMAPVGTDFLLSARPDQQGESGTHLAYEPNFSREPGSGPYTVNVIGQGVALTELNILVLSELLNPFASDGSFSTIQTVNYLWANSYWSNAEWVWEDTNSTDLSREMIRIMGSYGIRFNLMHSISREKRPEAEFPRTDVTVIGEAFNLTNTTDQDPNVKWFVVGSSSYKKSIYPQILEWGFDLAPCNPSAEKKGYPYCGPNALYDQVEPGSDPDDRERSDLFKYYRNLTETVLEDEDGDGDDQGGTSAATDTAAAVELAPPAPLPSSPAVLTTAPTAVADTTTDKTAGTPATISSTTTAPTTTPTTLSASTNRDTDAGSSGIVTRMSSLQVFVSAVVAIVLFVS